ncbi:MAG: hypothetical protein RL719_337 [Actinomycetota bacterium]
MRRIITLATIVATLFTASPALAFDNTWINSPNLSALKIVGNNIKVMGSGYNISTQSTGFDFEYTGLASFGGRFAQINIFDVTGGVGLALASNSSGTSSVACDPQVLSSDTHTCFFRLDGNAKAKIHVTVSNASAQGAFKYKILAGPNIQESAIAQVNFVTPTNSIKAVTTSAKAMLGGAGAVQFKVLQDGKVAPNIRVAVSFKGVGENLSTATATSNSSGLVTIYLTNLGKKKGTSVVTAQIDGGSAKTTASIVWVAGKLG